MVIAGRSMRAYDVVVVGAGPAGCMAAKYAAKAGASALLLEEHRAIGEPVHCAGLLSKRALEESELHNYAPFMAAEITGAVVRSPSAELLLESPDKHAFAVRRNSFDRELANAAQDAGVEIRLASRVKELQRGGETVRITAATTSGTEEVRARVVIGADGVRSTVAKLAGLEVAQRNLTCVQVEGAYETGRAGFAEILVGKSIAPGFFAWAIPLGADNTARIGLCIDKRCAPHPNPAHFLTQLLRQHPLIAKRAREPPLSRTAGMIPLPRPPTRSGRWPRTVTIAEGTGILLVGDAAAQIKPISGGGVYYGMKCGKLAGEIAARACGTGKFGVLNEYERRWRAELGKEIAFGLQIHRLRCVLRDEDFDTVIRTLSQAELAHRLHEAGDIDYPSLVFRGLLTNPGLLKVMARNLPKYLYTR
jgi:digeranylgeranylglycerophospholipid reductase